MRFQYLVLAAFVLFTSTAAPIPQATLENPNNHLQYHELFRPSYHYSTPKNWMNDPNGLLYHNGLYHMYYQYNPYGTFFGHINWGHAISTDLVHWENLPLAITEYGVDDSIQIYSGCVIVDFNNTSGYCTNKNTGCLLAFYTADSLTNQSQAFAYSNDLGTTYQQYPHNPLIDENLRDFRDPKVIWYEPEQKWVMITALSAQYKIRLFTSKDLINWTHLSDFGPDGSQAGVWEDPDLFLLDIEGEGTQKWVLYHAVNVNVVEYYIGDFDGTTFTNTDSINRTLYIDYGRDFCEAASWNNGDNIPSGRRMVVAWLDEGGYGGELPERAWRGQLTLIRDIKLRRYPEGLLIVQQPIAELDQLRVPVVHYDELLLNNDRPQFTLYTPSNQLEIVVNFTYPTSSENMPTEFGVNAFVGVNQTTIIGYNTQEQLIFVDRTNSGLASFDTTFASITNTTLTPENGTIQIRIFVDQCSVEVFANDGKVAMTNLIFPDPSQNEFQVFANGGDVTISSIDIYEIKGIWHGTGDTDEDRLSISS